MKLGATPAWLSCVSLSLTSVFGRRCCLMYCCVVGTIQQRAVRPRTSPAFKKPGCRTRAKRKEQPEQGLPAGIGRLMVVLLVRGVLKVTHCPLQSWGRTRAPLNKLIPTCGLYSGTETVVQLNGPIEPLKCACKHTC